MQNCYVQFDNVMLSYDLVFDRTTTLKEWVVNHLIRREYLQEKKAKLDALKNVSLVIEHGERLGVIGLNGSGKSTLLKLIAGLMKPSRGTIQIIGTIQPLIEIGAGFNYEFTGRENIYLNGAMLGFNKREIRRMEAEIIRFSEIEEFIDVPVKYYSSGMVTRLAFTIATSIKPEILLVDEMLSAGDLSFIQKAKDRITNLFDSAKIVVLVSHDFDLLRSLTTRTIVLDRGEVVFDGKTEEGVSCYEQRVKSKAKQEDHDSSSGLQ